jgi:hypothetical protein
MMEKVLNFASDHQQLVDLYRDATGKRPFEYGSMFGNEKVGSEILLSQAIHQSCT